jgi:hypothetical protein
MYSPVYEVGFVCEIAFAQSPSATSRGSWNLSQNLLDNISSDVSQSEVASLIFKGQSCVVDPRKEQDCRVQVVDVDGILRDVVTEIVRLAYSYAALNSASCQPHRKAAGMMVTAVLGFSHPAQLLSMPAIYNVRSLLSGYRSNSCS